MKKSPLWIASILLLLLFQASGVWAQSAKKTSYKNNEEVRTVQGCEYQVLKGLAEITAVEKTRSKSESALGYDEYSVKFKFIPMEKGQQLMADFGENSFDFFLRSGYDRLPVGPKYLKHYYVHKGQKFAMEFLQTGDKTCREQYTYKSLGIPNDLFEAQDSIKAYKIQVAAEKLYKKEKEVNEAKGIAMAEEAATQTSGNRPPEVAPVEEPKEEDPKEEEEPTEEDPKEEEEPEVDLNLPSDEELRKKVEAEMRAKEGIKKSPDEIDVDSLRAAIEKEERAKAKAEAAKQAELDQKNAIKREKQAAKERKKLEEQRRKEIKAKEEALRDEMAAKLAEEKEAIEARKEAIREQVTNEIRRESCVYEEKVSGTIKVVSVEEGPTEVESLFGYKEYVVTLRFKPDNYSDLSKKERKLWDKTFTFKLDPKGKSANPGATYVRIHKLFKGNKYNGFAQRLSSGICNDIMVYSPDLPIDASQVRK